MKYVSTIILRLVILAIAALVALFAIFLLPQALAEAALSYAYPVALAAGIGAYASLLPFFFALYQGLRLLGLIDSAQTFTLQSVKTFARIKYAAIIMSVCMAAMLPLFYAVADGEDAPGVMVIGLAITGMPFAIGVFAALMQRLFQNAVDIKQENDLTV